MTPEQEEQVRRALAAAARADDPGPMPTEVAARLAGVVDELAAPRRAPLAATAGPADADDDTALRGHPRDRRRRRRADGLVAAAAAVVLVAAGGAVAFQNLRGAGGGADSTAAGRSAVEGSGGGGNAPRTAPPAGARDLGDGDALTEPQLRTDTLEADVRQVAGALAGADADSGGLPGSERRVMVCDVPPTRRGDDAIVVRLDGKRATLVLAAPREGTREARVYPCVAPRAPIARTVVDAS